MSEERTPLIEASPGLGRTDRVEMRLPASSAYLAVVRTAAAGLAARLDFTLDEIEDLRIAVDEACGLLLPRRSSDTVEARHLECVFDIEPDALAIAVSSTDPQIEPPSRESFAWMVLTALAGEVDATRDAGGRVTIRMRKQRRAVADQ